MWALSYLDQYVVVPSPPICSSFDVSLNDSYFFVTFTSQTVLKAVVRRALDGVEDQGLLPREDGLWWRWHSYLKVRARPMDEVLAGRDAERVAHMAHEWCVLARWRRRHCVQVSAGRSRGA